MTTAETVDYSKCPPLLKQLIEKEGTMRQAARRMGSSPWTLTKIVRGEIPYSDVMQKRTRAALTNLDTTNEGHQMTEALTKTPDAPKTYAEWDGKRRNVKTMGVAGKVTTTKAVPGPLADLLDKYDGAKGVTARLLGYSGWGPIQTAYEDTEKYKLKLHKKVMAALAGEMPVNASPVEQVPDTFKLGLAIVLMNLNDYERIDEMANILGGQRVFRKSTKAGWLVIFKFLQKEKTEQFKRLASRDASEIVCP